VFLLYFLITEFLQRFFFWKMIASCRFWLPGTHVCESTLFFHVAGCGNLHWFSSRVSAFGNACRLLRVA